MGMLDFVMNYHKEKSIKRAFYTNYKFAITHMHRYSPYSDYLFSRTIDNIDLLVKLYEIHPTIKEKIFTQNNFFAGERLLHFLKRHYTQKQITKFFIREFQIAKKHKERWNFWEDTLHMIKHETRLDLWQENFYKVKLNIHSLHDELVRVSHLIQFRDNDKPFIYEQTYLMASTLHEGLEFKLPSSIQELSLWSALLKNCMFSYADKIMHQNSIIYGVFAKNKLLYAIELQEFQITQARAYANATIPEDDMKIIKKWEQKYFQTNQT